MTELKTIRDFLRYALTSFGKANIVHGHGTTQPIDEAAFMILESLNLPVDDINPWLDANLVEDERKKILEILETRIKSRLPAAYILKKIYLQGLPFYIDERAIVPRSYIGEILHNGLLGVDGEPLIENLDLVGSVLDICTGSGCLAVLAANYFPQAAITATDLSPDALEVARINIRDYGLGNRITLYEGDLFEPLKGRQFDLIIANPPYVAAAEVEAFPPEYQAEPRMAHIGGEDGLDLVRRILIEAPQHLRPGGNLICEIGLGRNIIEEEFADANLVWLDTAESEGEVFLFTV